MYFEVVLASMGAQNDKVVVTDEQKDVFCHTSGMERQTVDQYCEEFLKNHPKGRINRSEFSKFAKIALKNSSKVDMKEMSDHIFRMYDTDQDGYVTFIEFMVVYNLMNNGNAEDNLKQIFRIFDVNNDGTISLEEIRVLVKSISLMIENYDGVDKFKECSEKAFAEMDKDNNGKVTIDEFVTAILNQEQVSKFMALKVIEIFV